MISLSDEAYERLRAARRAPTESFSDEVMRAVWPDDALSGGTQKPPSWEIMKEALSEFDPGFQITREEPEVQKRSDSRD
jgi:hypothetical protein